MRHTTGCWSIGGRLAGIVVGYTFEGRWIGSRCTVGMGTVVEERAVAGRYRLTGRIGAGGMGVVWRAEDTRLRRIVAVKELLTRNGFDANSTRRVVREGRIAARLQHANVIALYDVVEDDGRPWLVMEYLPSRSLASLLAEHRTLPSDEVRRIGRQLAAGLAAAHAAGVVHRDVKPGNVLVTEFGTVKVTDFGTSRVVGEGTLTGSGLLVGTPAYLAPEVARGEEPGFPADVFGVGATLYTALEGTPPFGLDNNPIVLLHRAAEGKYAPAKNAGPLEPVLTRLLDPDPETRPSMAEAVRMLAEESDDPLTVFAAALPVAAATRVVLAPAPPAEPTPADQALVEQAPVEQPSADVDQAVVEEAPVVPAPVEPSVDAPAVLSEPAVEPAGGRNRKRLVLLVAGLSVVLVVVVAVVLLNQTPSGQTGTGGTTATTTAAEPPAADGNTPPTSGQETTSESPPTTTTSELPKPAGPDQALTGYYGLLPGDLQTGFARLTDGFKAGRGLTFAGYQQFWGRVQQVQLADVQVDGDQVTATVTYLYVDGSQPLVERNTYSMVRVGDGWAIDRQDRIG